MCKNNDNLKLNDTTNDLKGKTEKDKENDCQKPYDHTSKATQMHIKLTAQE
jgi:hypothetical protein